MNLDFPFRVDARGRTATTSLGDHVRDLVEQVLFTNPGERVNRPNFGAGLRQMVFAPSSPEVAAALQYLVQGELQRYLADLIEVAEVSVEAADTSLLVEVSYVLRATGSATVARVEVEL